MRLENKVAIVTGAGQGIGKAIADRFVREGAKVLLSDIDGARAESAARAVSNDAAVCSAAACDVTRSGEIGDMVALAVERYGRLDIAVANAGIGHESDFLKLEEADFDRVMRVNVNGVMLTVQAAARQMAAQGGGGSIVTIGSIAGKRVIPTQIPYCTSKAGGEPDDGRHGAGAHRQGHPRQRRRPRLHQHRADARDGVLLAGSAPHGVVAHAHRAPGRTG